MTTGSDKTLLLKTERKTGIIGYGAYVPRYRLPNTEVARVWAGGGSGMVKEKSVAGLDEDVITMSIEAARNALVRAGIDPANCAPWGGGSESHPTRSSLLAQSWPKPSVLHTHPVR
jgi:hydroxymethylglutaryl-CoA synthase